ncbi:MAG: hypothetical protein NXI00_02560 [Cytophagales bacterium]|nr:hypothetical protein [Cytophagales bacterium]
MKKIIILMFTVFGIFACKDSKNTLIPVPEVEQSIYPFDTTRYQTKEPFIILEDKGLEAFLVINGQDTDNQVNGKISEADAKQIKELNLRTPFYELEQNKYLYFGNLYSLLDMDNKEIFDSHLPKLPIKSISDLKKFPNLTNLYATCFENIGTFDFSDNDKLNSIDINYIGNTKIVGIDSLESVFWQAFRQFSKDDSLFQSRIDLSQINYVGSLWVRYTSDIEFPKNTAEDTYIYINRSDVEGTKLTTFLAKRKLRDLHLGELPNLTSLVLASNNNARISVSSCMNLEEINFEKVENISEIQVVNCPLLKTIDISKYKDIYLIDSRANTKLDTIFINKDLDLKRSGINCCTIQKDPWTSWKIKE